MDAGNGVQLRLDRIKNDIAIGPRSPWGEVYLNLTDCVLRGACAACVIVQSAITRKGKDIAHALKAKHPRLDLCDQSVFFFDRQIAARAHIDNCVFRLGLHEEIHAVIVGPVIAEGHDNKAQNRGNGQNGGKRVAHQTLYQQAQSCALISALNPFNHARADQCAHDNRHGQTCNRKSQNARQDRKKGGGVWPRTAAPHNHQGGLKQGKPHHNRKSDANGATWHKAHQQHTKAIRASRQTGRNAPHHGQIDQRHNQRGGENKDQRDRKHPHKFTRNPGPE